MVDFLMISMRYPKKDVVEIYPTFILTRSSDLMIRGSDFYAIWLKEKGLWSTDEQDALRLIDKELDQYAEDHKNKINPETRVKILHMWDSNSGMIDRWHKYCQKQMRDNFHMLDEQIIFSNMETTKQDYASMKLDYPLKKSSTSAYDKLMSTLYSEEERKKIEWAIGSIVTGDSKTLQKFVVLYGSAGTGKSTVLNIIQELFEGYCSVFDSKALGSASNSFALEAFKNNPMVSIDHDGDMSRLEDNTKFNSLVSHEMMTVNEKFKSAYTNRFKTFLFIGTNKPVKITDAKSGLLRRLIDVSPSGNKLPVREYNKLMKEIKFELGGIAWKCKEVYLADPEAYDNYIPVAMMGATNDFYNFVLDSCLTFEHDDGVSLKTAWEMYKTYCDEAKIRHPYPRRIFKEELKNYFRNYEERSTMEDGSRPWNYYSGFKAEELNEKQSSNQETSSEYEIIFEETDSIFDEDYADCPAQYANNEEKPFSKWSNVTTHLFDLDTTKMHYVKVPKNHIVIDFDIKDENGDKSFEKNLKEASKWPPTYAELSKGGVGIHLHYIYVGDITLLKTRYAKDIEIKKFTGNSSLRRKLTKCNALPIATISSGLPTKGEKEVVNFESVKSEKSLRKQIKRNLAKEIHPATKPSIDFIYKILEDAYKSDLKYDVSDMYNSVLSFAANSTHQADYCIKLVGKMHFKSDYISDNKDSDDSSLVFFDVEIFPNLFLVNWKKQGENKPVVRMINPDSQEIENLMHFNLVGFNCRRYDNHILYARMIGYTVEELYRLSQKIIDGNKNAFFGEAYNVSYTDVYDFSSKKQSLKKFEIELGIHHQELGLPWDEPVPEDQWLKVSEYCDNDVIATEAVFNARKGDFTARQILADLAGGTVNDTTNSLTAKIIFGKERHPQSQFRYRDMSSKENGCHGSGYELFDNFDRPIFPGYKFDKTFRKSTYRGEEVGEGGYVYAEPGMYGNVALLDVQSMHPSSIIAEDLFGPEYTLNFKDILSARLYIKHGEFEKARNMLGGKLAKYLTDESVAADLAQALKIVVNSVYGLTAASFDNPFRDSRNIDNIVAKRGALFMINLKYAVQEKGFTVCHCKTDGIKVADATPEIIQFIKQYGEKYGYDLDHQATYDRMCLVNNAVYIAKYKDGKYAGKWTATGKQFQVPYVFKKLFSKEPIIFEDLCEAKEVKSGSGIYLDRNEGMPDVREYQKQLSEIESKYKKGQLSDIEFEKICADLNNKIAVGHNYKFVGKIGLFCPIKPGHNGGELMCERNGKYHYVTGTSGYRWMEAEVVKDILIPNNKKENLPWDNDIDYSYYEKMVADARKAISAFGDFTWFVSDDPYFSPKYDENGAPIYEVEIPF